MSLLKVLLRVASVIFMALSLSHRGKAGATVKSAQAEATTADIFLPVPDPKGQPYFPPGAESYYTRILRSMREPSLLPYVGRSDNAVMRFTWLRSFHDQIAVRIWRERAVWKIRSICVTIGANHTPVSVSKDATRDLTAEEMSRIQGLTGKDFWRPLNESELTVAFGGCDGARWLFERLDGEDYSFLDIWSPSLYLREREERNYNSVDADSKKIRDFKPYIIFGLHLLKLGGVLPSKDIY